MAGVMLIKPGSPAGRFAVVDIGSNSVRLVVYDAPTRLPIPMYNEKAQCALGRGMGQTGRLNQDGVECALTSIKRFYGLAHAMGVETLDMVATAAVREAEDGPEFTARVNAMLGHEIQVLSGEDEAKYAALGLLMGVPAADGVIGDLGGGSLDLVELNQGQFGQSATFALGHLRLSEAAGGDAKKALGIVDDALKGLDWLGHVKGRTLYAAGGSWRALARMLIDHTQHPLHVVDNFTIASDDARPILQFISNAERSVLEQIPGIPKKRIDTLPFAAAALEGMINATGAAKVQFSGFGMREGVLLSVLPEALRHQDPLLSACKTMAERTGRFALTGREIRDWMAPLFPDENAAERRLRYAACLMSDIGWNEHPDYRAEHTFIRALRIPYAGLLHADRALLATTLYIRQNGNIDDALVQPTLGLLDAGQLTWVRVMGLALRLAHTISGSAPGLLSHTTLRVEGDTLTLDIPPEYKDTLRSEAVDRRLKTLARSLNMKT
ncbi:MAG TPA: Ppx/GppA family phosphatase [Magnetovibrio sp.]